VQGSFAKEPCHIVWKQTWHCIRSLFHKGPIYAGLFGKRALTKEPCILKEPWQFSETTNRFMYVASCWNKRTEKRVASERWHGFLEKTNMLVWNMTIGVWLSEPTDSDSTFSQLGSPREASLDKIAKIALWPNTNSVEMLLLVLAPWPVDSWLNTSELYPRWIIRQNCDDLLLFFPCRVLRTYRFRDYSLAVTVLSYRFDFLKFVVLRRGGGLGSSTIFKKFNEPYAPS